MRKKRKRESASNAHRVRQLCQDSVLLILVRTGKLQTQENLHLFTGGKEDSNNEQRNSLVLQAADQFLVVVRKNDRANQKVNGRGGKSLVCRQGREKGGGIEGPAAPQALYRR